MIVICLGFAIPVSYTALYAQSLGLSNAGMFFFVGAIAMTASRFLGGRLLDIVPPRILFLMTNPVSYTHLLHEPRVHEDVEAGRLQRGLAGDDAAARVRDDEWASQLSEALAQLDGAGACAHDRCV